MSLFRRWLNAYLITLVLETPVVVHMLRGRTPSRTAMELSVLASTLTHPLFWFAWRPLIDDYWTYVVSGEILVVLAETVVYRKVTSWRHAFLVSLVANATSCVLGLALQWSFSGP